MYINSVSQPSLRISWRITLQAVEICMNHNLNIKTGSCCCLLNLILQEVSGVQDQRTWWLDFFGIWGHMRDENTSILDTGSWNKYLMPSMQVSRWDDDSDDIRFSIESWAVKVKYLNWFPSLGASVTTNIPHLDQSRLTTHLFEVKSLASWTVRTTYFRSDFWSSIGVIWYQYNTQLHKNYMHTNMHDSIYISVCMWFNHIYTSMSIYCIYIYIHMIICHVYDCLYRMAPTKSHCQKDEQILKQATRVTVQR